MVLPSQPQPSSPRKILIIKLVEQGATVLACRAIERATELVGRENVYFWVFERNRSILDLLAILPPQNILTVRDSGVLAFASDVLAGLWRIRRLGIDATIDMEFFARGSVILAFLSGAGRRVGLHRFTTEGPFRGDLLTHRLAYNPYLHTAAAYYLLVDAVTAPFGRELLCKVLLPRIDFAPPRFIPEEREVGEVREILQGEAARLIAGQVVLLNPNAGDMLPLRRWPAQAFVELGKRLLAEDCERVIVVTGAPDERQAALTIAKGIDDGPAGRAVCLAGRTTLRQLVVLYTISDLLVTNDSGPGHFSSLARLPAIVLFGPETSDLFGPLGTATQVLSSHLACSPCVNAMNHRRSPCTDNVCMQHITVDQVYEAAHRLLCRKYAKVQLTILPTAPMAFATADGT